MYGGKSLKTSGLRIFTMRQASAVVGRRHGALFVLAVGWLMGPNLAVRLSHQIGHWQQQLGDPTPLTAAERSPAEWTP